MKVSVSPPPRKSVRAERVVTLAVVVGPFLGLLAAMVAAWGRGISGIDLALMAGMYALTGLGVTVGFHRLFTHRSFQAVRPLKWALAVLGSMAAQGPLLTWVAVHRRHHRHSDREDDPHSPHSHGGGVRGVLMGFLHAHVGWMLKPHPTDQARYVRDLRRDHVLRRISDWFGAWVALGLLLPAVAGGLLTGSWPGALLGLLWGGLARMFVLHHVTWSVNSVCHLWGGRPFGSDDQSRNNPLFGILGFGEGWHNNHHAFPSSARHGLRWWEFDLSYGVIRVLEAAGLAWGVRVPAPAVVEARRVIRAPARDRADARWSGAVCR